jgi:hypothetical protein
MLYRSRPNLSNDRTQFVPGRRLPHGVTGQQLPAGDEFGGSGSAIASGGSLESAEDHWYGVSIRRAGSKFDPVSTKPGPATVFLFGPGTGGIIGTTVSVDTELGP